MSRQETLHLHLFLLALLSLSLLFSQTRSAIIETKSTSDICPSYVCGGVLIKYPFWYNGSSTPNPHCGYPSFGLSCSDDNKTTLKVSTDTYNVAGINYETKTLSLIDADVLTGNAICPRAKHNVTLTSAPQLRSSDSTKNLTFFFDCSTHFFLYLSSDYPSVLVSTKYTNLSCLASGGNQTLVFETDKIPEGLDWHRDCEAKVVTTVMEEAITNVFSRTDGFAGALRNGFELDWGGIGDCVGCEESGGYCAYSSNSTTDFFCFCEDGKSGNRCSGVSTCGLILVVPILSFFLRRKFFSSNSIGYWKTNAESLEECLKNFGSMAPTRYKYSDIKKITNVFKDKLGQGGYGGVYKGTLIDGRLVAVKVLTESKGNGEEFTNEVVSITRTSHVNIVTLLGFCIEGPKRALVYEFMPNGSLEKFIYDDDDDDDEALVENHPRLGFERLYQIALGIARGLEYLHRGCNTRIVHFDIKPHNILLDEDFRPKISDFGLAKLCPRQESILSMTGARGTVGYIAPEVFSRNFGVVSHKSDVYSYGMMVLEMVGRRKNVSVKADHTSEIYFPHWIYKRLEIEEGLGLLGIKSDAEEEIAKKMILVGLWCIQTDPAKRPPMDKVLDMLARSIESLQIPPKPFLYSPPRSPTDSPTVRDEEDSATTSISTPIIEEMSESQEIDLLNSVKTSRSHSRSQHGFSLAI
ncbi:PREDICTED: LEAF RUST 10 DISEASE-RESISTANCE LOCUS RECEPTOR-LIKE PROTEIN KINASE-like 2.4 isoform X2 [Nelumbo nucifera]|uniref:LEAF RUST 10 DISEASE-RESISTANCE LOCUS RECEPTOR-LIKE PROTEIN KINASE-like 2.4 isoform X2 n=1 Tax=Nelumbo nucifera TaxID=4432 RepID=A0A1U8AB85_NELNU|nr:PREDICTED: LEAF RUST 10 DISEASE-RESISTANCE LOCUS RECEPTOR-LIKE PROTEIN KINASE-like 2.4 isoform X2 [Nelumbo nucifera]